jgi:fluoride ion exporter CrcB/FEX
MSLGIILLNIAAVGLALLVTGAMIVEDFHIWGAIALFFSGFSAGFSTLATLSFRYSANYNPQEPEDKS